MRRWGFPPWKGTMTDQQPHQQRSAVSSVIGNTRLTGLAPAGEGVAEGEPAPTGEGAAEGEPAPTGEGAAEGEPVPTGERAAEVEPALAGERTFSSSSSSSESESSVSGGGKSINRESIRNKIN